MIIVSHCDEWQAVRDGPGGGRGWAGAGGAGSLYFSRKNNGGCLLAVPGAPRSSRGLWDGSDPRFVRPLSQPSLRMDGYWWRQQCELGGV